MKKLISFTFIGRCFMIACLLGTISDYRDVYCARKGTKRVGIGTLNRLENQVDMIPGQKNPLTAIRQLEAYMKKKGAALAAPDPKLYERIKQRLATLKSKYVNAPPTAGTRTTHTSVSSGQPDTHRTARSPQAPPSTTTRVKTNQTRLVPASAQSIPAEAEWTQLHDAAEKGDLQEVELQCWQVGVDVADEFGRTPLHAATRKGHQHVVEFLVSKGANMNVQTSGGWTPLYIAAMQGNINLVRFFCEKGADKGVRNKKGETAHDIADTKWHVEVAEYLSGTSQSTVSVRTATTTTSRTTESEERVDVVASRQRLSEPKHSRVIPPAGVVKVGSQKNTALELAVQGETEEIIALLEGGLSTEIHDSEGKTLLHLATQYRHTSLALCLLEFEASVNAQVQVGQHQGRAPLHYAVIGQMRQVVEGLLAVGASPGIADSFGYTSLHWAVSNEDTPIIELLLAHGAQPDARDAGGRTPLQIAQDGGMTAIEVLLEQKLPEQNVSECTICLEQLIGGDADLVVSPCGHVLHKACSRGLDTCPNCRGPVGPGGWRRLHL